MGDYRVAALSSGRREVAAEAEGTGIGNTPAGYYQAYSLIGRGGIKLESEKRTDFALGRHICITVMDG